LKHTTLLADSLFLFFQLQNKRIINFVGYISIFSNRDVNSDVMRCLSSNWTISVSGICLPFQLITSIFAVSERFFTYLLTVSINRLKSIIFFDYSIPKII